MAYAMQVQPAQYLDLQALLKSQDPVIDLRVEEFEAASAKFLRDVVEYTNRAIEEIAARKRAHAQELQRVTEKKQQMETDITNYKMEEMKLMAVLEREQAERSDAEASVQELNQELQGLKEKCISLDITIEQYRSELSNLNREKERDQKTLHVNAMNTNRDLGALEQRLQCVFQGLDKDKILVRFKAVDASAPAKDFLIVLDVSSRIYKVPMSSPPIPDLPLLVQELNETRDIYAFIKDVRRTFENMAAKT